MSLNFAHEVAEAGDLSIVHDIEADSFHVVDGDEIVSGDWTTLEAAKAARDELVGACNCGDSLCGDCGRR